jgi:hypothetical protein
MPTLTVNLVDGADYQEQRTPDGIFATATRIAIVDGLADGSDNASANMLLRAYAIVAAQYPYGLIYDPARAFCILTGYGAAGFVEDSSAVKIALKFTTLNPLKPQVVPWTVEDDGYIQLTHTQLDKDGAPLRVHYDATQDADNPGGRQFIIEKLNSVGTKSNTKPLIIDEIVTLTYPEPVRKVVLSGIIPKAMVVQLRKSIGVVNEDDWSLLGKGHWRITRLGSTGVVGIPYRKAVVEIDGLVELDWMTFGILRDHHTGNFLCADADAKKFRKAAYIYGTEKGNGIIRAGFLRLANFASIFGISDINQL